MWTKTVSAEGQSLTIYRMIFDTVTDILISEQVNVVVPV